MVGYTKGLGYPTIQKAREGLESLDPRDDRAFHHLIAPTITGSLTRLTEFGDFSIAVARFSRLDLYFTKYENHILIVSTDPGPIDPIMSELEQLLGLSTNVEKPYQQEHSNLSGTA
ncbi:hypothetical protein DRO42_00350 [Candidatus Bathyarchaeota archaeon]|nr:MAG: hypothetical protein DRO42_00350 [Candidatus Bathyarchaeota archaeon]